jgi:preprotein translocase subunit YajC
MDILIFAIGLVIFVTYMYFLIRMINRAHKQQEKELETNLKDFVKKYNVKKLKDEEWDS